MVITLKVQPVLERSSYDINFFSQLRDLWDLLHVYVAPSQASDVAGEGLYVRRKVPRWWFLVVGCCLTSNVAVVGWSAVSTGWGIAFMPDFSGKSCHTLKGNLSKTWTNDIDAQSGQALVRVWLPSKVLAGTLASNEQIKSVKFLVDIKCSQTCVTSSNYHLVPFCVDPPHSDYMICCDPMYNLDIPDHYTSTANYAATLAHKVHY